MKISIVISAPSYHSIIKKPLLHERKLEYVPDPYMDVNHSICRKTGNVELKNPYFCVILSKFL